MNMASVENGIHRRLQQATQPCHARLEARLPLLDPALSRSRYRCVLEAFYGFYDPLEAAMMAVPCGSLRQEVARRRKSQWLAQDLEALGETGVGLSALPRCAALPEMQGPASVLGALYVVEGATLGGQMVSRLLGQSLGRDADRCTRFFRSYGQAVGPMWNAFLALLTERARDRQTERDIIAAACATFSSFEQWLA